MTPASSTTRGSLTPQQVHQYEKDGYLVLEGLLSDQDMEPARVALTAKVDEIARGLLQDGLIADKLEHRPFELRLAELASGLTDQQFLKYGRSWRDRHPGYFELMSNPKIIDVIESLIGPEIFANPVYNSRPKVPRVAAGAVPWHQDKSYWPNANSNPVITVWIPLVDSTHENGCLHVIPGTQHKKLIDFHNETYSGTGFLETDLKVVERESRKRPIIALPVKAGSAILFNDRLLHMSTPNNSNHVRWSVDLRYQPTDQDPMPAYGIGFLARSEKFPQRVATMADWLAGRPEHEG
jgi:hypothetical protein